MTFYQKEERMMVGSKISLEKFLGLEKSLFITLKELQTWF